MINKAPDPPVKLDNKNLYSNLYSNRSNLRKNLRSKIKYYALFY